MRVISLNCNGIRSAARKGFFGWLARQDADVICLQETRAQEHEAPVEALSLSGYTGYFADAQRRGYSGVAVYTHREPDRISRTCGTEAMDAEGRFLRLDFGPLSVSSVYVPSGTTGAARQGVKLAFLEHFAAFLEVMRCEGRRHIVCGDYNIAHTERDIYDPVRNRGVTGFTPRERAWMDALLHAGWADAFRVVNDEPGQYSWWSNWPQAWIRNLGWRIDYQIVTENVRPLVRDAAIYRGDRFSDHAPVTIDYALDF